MTTSNEPKKYSFHIQQLRKSLGLPDEAPVEQTPVELTEGALKYIEKMKLETAEIKLPAIYYLNRLINAGYVIDAENELIVKKLCLYFAGDMRMVQPPYNLEPQKGIALLGGLGVGKTWLMKLLRYNAHLPFAFVNCSQIADECEQGGSENMARYFKKTKTSSSYLYYNKTEIGFCFNELGREQMPVKYFGNPTNVMERIMFTRYENEVPYNFTHFTSNKSVKQLGELYGDYIRDRMKEMFNLIVFPETAKSRRK